MILGTALTSFGVLLLGRMLLSRLPEPTPASSAAQLAAERQWSLDPERRRLAALLLSSRDPHQPKWQWSWLRSRGWGTTTLAAVTLKQQALAAGQLGRQGEADQRWQQLAQRFPHAASTADALYALGRTQPELRTALLVRFPSHPAALAAALEQATDTALPARQRLIAAGHLARSGPRWPVPTPCWLTSAVGPGAASRPRSGRSWRWAWRGWAMAAERSAAWVRPPAASAILPTP